MTSHLDARLAMIRRRLRRRWPNGVEFALLPKADQKALAALVQKWGREVIHKAVDGAATKPAHRPRKVVADFPEQIAQAIDWMADEISQRGCHAGHGDCKAPLDCALRQAAALDHVEVSTMRRKYNKGRRALGRAESKA